MKRFTTRVDAATLTNEIRAFRLRLERRTTHQYYPHARQLYDWLIRPIAAELEKHQVDTLVIVPDGALRTIPLAALHDGEQLPRRALRAGHDAGSHADRPAPDRARRARRCC